MENKLCSKKSESQKLLGKKLVTSYVTLLISYNTVTGCKHKQLILKNSGLLSSHTPIISFHNVMHSVLNKGRRMKITKMKIVS